VRRHPALLTALATTAVAWCLASPRTNAADGPIKPKVLVEFGWDEPDTAFLRKHIATMERTPFDGCVFHAITRGPKGETDNLAWKFWGRKAFTEAELAPALDDLKATRTSRFRHNYLRINTTPGDFDWFDDFSAVLTNARLAGKLARDGGCKGVLLDIEQYEKPLFEYRKQVHNDTKSWDDYAAQARLRGRALMDALQQGFPGLTVFSTFGPSLVYAQTGKGKTPVKDASYGLLVPLLQGMSDAVRGGTRLVDGHELSYGYKDSRRFDEALGVIRALQPKMEAGFAVWLDHDWRRRGWNGDDPSKNEFTPAVFEGAVRAALERSDEIVWVYTESPRWWSEPDGRPVKLPAAYLDALRRARRGLAAD
jgi:hypothetical protein